MTLRNVIEKEKDFSRFGRGNWKDISLRDRDDETIKVVPINALDTIEDVYLDSKFLTIGSSTVSPTRLRIRIDYDI